MTNHGFVCWVSQVETNKWWSCFEMVDDGSLFVLSIYYNYNNYTYIYIYIYIYIHIYVCVCAVNVYIYTHTLYL